MSTFVRISTFATEVFNEPLSRGDKILFFILFLVVIGGIIGIPLFLFTEKSKQANLIWRGAVVPYIISDDFNEQEKTSIYQAMDTITQASRGIKFKKRKAEISFVNINKTNVEGSCGSATMGKRLKAQDLYLNPDCIDQTTIIHELMHSLGFPHEQSRMDRDKFINYRGNDSNFEKIDNKVYRDIISKTPFDIESIMLYDNRDYIYTFIGDESKIIYTNQILSPIDIERLQTYYKLYK